MKKSIRKNVKHLSRIHAFLAFLDLSMLKLFMQGADGTEPKRRIGTNQDFLGLFFGSDYKECKQRV